MLVAERIGAAREGTQPPDGKSRLSKPLDTVSVLELDCISYERPIERARVKLQRARSYGETKDLDLARSVGAVGIGRNKTTRTTGLIQGNDINAGNEPVRCLLRVHPGVRPRQLDGHVRKEQSQWLAVRRPAMFG
jgi:hypothetical protein